MILAEKIMKHRKENGWSQEELAVKLNVSRQSVSKWESGASIPDLDKILKLSGIFGVSTDYLLKDELESDTGSISIPDSLEEETADIRKVSLDEANRYLNLAETAAKRFALGVAACILATIPVLLLGAMAEYKVIHITEDMAGGIGVTLLLLIIAGAVTLFIVNGMKMSKFEYLEKEALSLEYGIAGIVQNKQEAFEPVFKKCIAAGVALCIISVTPLMIAAAFDAPDIVYVYCVCGLLAIIAFAVSLFVWAGMINGSYQHLLEEGDYTREKKLENKKNERLATVYWCTVTAIYLGYSFITMEWHRSWVVWPCAGILYAAVLGIAGMLRK